MLLVENFEVAEYSTQINEVLIFHAENKMFRSIL